MNLDGDELALLARIQKARGRLTANALDDGEQESAKRLVYLGYLARADDHLVLTKAGAQALNHNHP